MVAFPTNCNIEFYALRYYCTNNDFVLLCTLILIQVIYYRHHLRKKINGQSFLESTLSKNGSLDGSLFFSGYIYQLMLEWTFNRHPDLLLELISRIHIFVPYNFICYTLMLLRFVIYDDGVLQEGPSILWAKFCWLYNHTTRRKCSIFTTKPCF